LNPSEFIRKKELILIHLVICSKQLKRPRVKLIKMAHARNIDLEGMIDM